MARLSYQYRRTGAGGLDIAFVFKENGELVEAVQRVRSRSGTHGWDVYVLQPGIYYVVLLSRPNGPKPITVRYRRLIVDSSVKGQDVGEAELPQAVIEAVKRILKGA